MADHGLQPGLYETLLTGELAGRLERDLDPTFHAALVELGSAAAPDRLARHVAGLVERAILQLLEEDRAVRGAEIARQVIAHLEEVTPAVTAADEPSDPVQLLASILKPLPNGSL